MNNEVLDSLKSQVNNTYCIVTRTYDAAGNMTGESRREHPEPYVRITHDQGVELLKLIDLLKESARPITHESAIDFLREENWLQSHDRILTQRMEPMTIKKYLDGTYGVIGGKCPNCHNWVQSVHSFCGFCGQAVKWDG